MSSATPPAPSVIPVQVGGSGTATALTFNPNNIVAPVGSTVSFVFSGAPGNHTVTQSSFTSPCEPLANGFDSGWVPVPADSSAPSPTWNLTITNATAPIWFYCKQLNGPNKTPHCNLEMVGVINDVAAKPFSTFQASASAASTVGQAQGGLSGIGAFATASPSPTATAPASGSSGGASASPSPSGKNSGVSNGVRSITVLLAALSALALVF